MTPVQQLQANRLRMTRALGGPDDGSGVPTATVSAPGASHASGWRLGRQALRTWWRHHPAHAAVQIAHPLLQRYAHEKPLRLVGVAAGVGAALVLLKPWRLLSAGTIASAALKTTDVPGLLVSLLAQNAPPAR